MFYKELLFPKFCLGCGYLGVYFCQQCLKQFLFIENDRCLYCGNVNWAGVTHTACRKKLGVDGCMSLLHYNSLARKMIKSIKYRLATSVWDEFWNILKPERLWKLTFYKKLQPDLNIQPVPISSGKYSERGFNQAQIIADKIGSLINVASAEYLIRIKNTLPQAQILKKQSRYKNIRGAFKFNKKNNIENRNVLLIDDVITSGSTVKEASRILKLNGARSVYVFTICRG